MNKVEIEVPDDRWIRGEWEIRPQDKQLCIVLMKDDLFPMICQWNKGIDCGDRISRGYFADVSSTKVLMEIGEVTEDWRIYMELVDCWKPLGLPEDVNNRVLEEIEKWFEGE